MKNNEDLEKDVQAAIKWEPALFTSEIGVTVHDGVVTLTGVVDSYMKKLHAENTAKSVTGVKAVAEKIVVRISFSGKQTDTHIAEAAINALRLNTDIPTDKIMIKVENGWITLEGEVISNYQKNTANEAVANLTGVFGVINSITIKTNAHDAIEKKDIENALIRNSAIDKSNIHVEVTGNSIILTGSVVSLYQKEEAERIAWKAPGVWLVQNELSVEYQD